MRDKVIVGNAFLDDGFTREIPSAGLCGIIDDLQGLFHRIASSDVELHVPSDWEVMEFSDGCELWEVLYQNPGDYGLSIGQVNDFSRLLQQSATYDPVRDDDLVSPGRVAPTCSGCYSRVHGDRDDGPLAVIAGAGYVGGITHVIRNSDGTRVGFYSLILSSKMTDLFREHLISRECCDDDFSRYSKNAFPLICFADNLSPKSLNVDLRLRAPQVVDHLAYLNDLFASDMQSVNWSPGLVASVAAGRGVALSDESVTTKKSEKKMKQRDATFTRSGSKIVLRCSMHTKLDFDNGRIHFCLVEVEGKALVHVGLMCAHLET